MAKGRGWPVAAISRSISPIAIASRFTSWAPSSRSASCSHSVDWLIRRISANAEQFLGKPAEDLLGTSAIALLGEHAVHTLRNRLAMLRGDDAVERVFGLRIASGRCFDFALHMIGDTIVLEGEDCSEDAATDIGSAIRAMMARLDETGDSAAFIARAPARFAP